MKKTAVYILVTALLLLCLTACKRADQTDPSNGEPDPGDEYYREHQTLTDTEFDFDANSMLRINLLKAGLENVFIRDISPSTALMPDPDDSTTFSYGTVYLLADDRYGGGMSTSDLYLAVVCDGKMTVKDLAKWEDNFSYFNEMTLCDLDRDGDKEIVLQQCVSMTGGAGGYLSRVFNFVNGKIVEIFSSTDEDNNLYDTGFSATVLPENKLKIENRFTGYEESFGPYTRTAEYFSTWWYDENGDPKSIDLGVDSFFEFIPKDVDGDGFAEIECRQYTSLAGHLDYVGTAVSVLQYNADTKQFELIDAHFEPENGDHT